MAYVFKVIPDLNLVSVRATGRIDAESVKELLESYGTHPLARPGQNILHDLTRITGSTITDSQRVMLQMIVEPLFQAGNTQRKLVLFTSPGISHDFAVAMKERFWQNTPYVSPYVTTDHTTACDLLQIPYQPFALFHSQAA